MYAVTNEFKAAMKANVKEVDSYIELADFTKITGADNLISTKIDVENHLGQVVMRLLTVKLLGDFSNLKDQSIKLYVGVKTTDFEYIDYGHFLVREANQEKASGTTTLKAYDNMIFTHKAYEANQFTYPMTIYQLASRICQRTGIELGGTSWPNSTLTIATDRHVGLDYQYRDVLQDIACVSGTIVMIANDKLTFKSPTASLETITEDNLIAFSIGDKYGPVNAVVIGRSPQEDNVMLKDDESIALNGLCEWRVDNVQLIDNQRETAISPLYANLNGLTYYPFEAKTEGHGWYEIGDKITAFVENESREIMITSISLTIDGAISETIKGTAQESIGTNYNRAGSIGKRLKRTEIIVDKQANTIQSVVEDVADQDTRVTTVEQTASQLNILVGNLDSRVTINENTTDDIGTSINSLEGRVSSNESTVAKVNTNFTFTAEGLEIGKSNARTRTVYANEGMQIYTDGSLTAEATSEQFNSYKRLGVQDWAIEQGNDGKSLNFYRKG